MAAAVTSLLLLSLFIYPLYSSISPQLSSTHSDTQLPRPSHNTSYDHFYSTFARPFMIERTPGSPGSAQVVQFITTTLTSFGLNVEKQAFTSKGPDGKEYKFVNVWAETNPKSTNKVMLSCHHDSKIMDSISFIGAIDSAIPCAIILYLASHFAPPQPPSSHSTVASQSGENSCWKSIVGNLDSSEVSIMFMFFDGEEAIQSWTETDSLYGSRYFVAQLKQPHQSQPGGKSIKDIKLMILLDLIGSKQTKFSKFVDFKSDKCFDRLREIELQYRSSSLTCCNQALHYSTSYNHAYFQDKLQQGMILDDHVPFLREGVPVLHLISSPFPPVWHQQSDNEENLHHPTIENLIQIFTTFMSDLSCIS